MDTTFWLSSCLRTCKTPPGQLGPHKFHLLWKRKMAHDLLKHPKLSANNNHLHTISVMKVTKKIDACKMARDYSQHCYDSLVTCYAVIYCSNHYASFTVSKKLGEFSRRIKIKERFRLTKYKSVTY